jgi:ABC-type nitrate/sulfonate/bicarbonate transport system substrate-binding protein
MSNGINPIDKLGFRPRRPRRGPYAAVQTDRATLNQVRAIEPAGVDAPVHVGHGPIPTATTVAGRLGWLEREAALDGTPLAVGGDPLAAPLRDSLLRAAASSGTLREGDALSALWAHRHVRPTRLIGLTWVDGFHAVVSAASSGIGAPDQLAGRRVGLPRDVDAPVDTRRAAARHGVRATLALAGLFPEEVVDHDLDVRGVPGPYAAELAALERGDVDAIYLAGATGLVAATSIGAVTVVDLGASLDPAVRASASAPAAITVDAGLLEQQPLLVVRLLAVLLRAGAWAAEHPEDAASLLAEDAGVTLPELTAAHGRGVGEQLQVDLSERKLSALRTHHEFLRTYGFLDEDVDLGRWVDPRPLAEARDLLAAERTLWV